MKPGANWSWKDVPGGKPKALADRDAKPKAAKAESTPAPAPKPEALAADPILTTLVKEIATMAASVKELQAEIDRLRADIVAMPKVWAMTEASFRQEIAGLHGAVEAMRARPDNPDRDADIDRLRKHVAAIERERDRAIGDVEKLKAAKPERPALLPPIKPETKAWLAELRDRQGTTIDRVAAQILDEVAADDIAAHAETAEAAE